jgi:UDPglucose 6-dehydrogenase
MNVLVIGMGYVGTTLSLVLAKSGHHVTGLDLDLQKISALNQGNIYFHEPGLQELLDELTSTDRLSFTTDVQKSIHGNDVVFICVGTPSNEDGSANLQYIKSAATMIGENINDYKVVIIKSTVPVGTNETFESWIQEANTTEFKVDVVSNPEFLREGNALNDSLNPDRVVIGSSSDRATAIVKQLYHDVDCPILVTSRKGAELIKYTANAFLALKISFINEVAKLCDTIGVNIQDISKGIGTDHRIGSHFLNASLGYGGSCFPKDVSALLSTAAKYNVPLNIMKEVVAVNQIQPKYLLSQIKQQLGNLTNKKMALLGLSFKPHTDDIRESPALKMIDLLLKEDAIIHVHDPVVKLHSTKIDQFNKPEEAVENADAIIICTEWPQYNSLPWKEIKGKMNTPYIFDGRNMLDREQIKQIGFLYRGIGYS